MPPYPHIPKSTQALSPGDFWALPLSDGSFGCGRVLQTTGDHLAGPRRLFFGGVLDWRGEQPPMSPSIAGRPLVACGQMHVRAIAESGGQVLGNRPLELDGIELPLLLSTANGPAMLLYGVQSVRRARKDEQGSLPALSTWGLSVAVLKANHHFGLDADASS